MKGKLIVIDGTDGSGKGTQAELLMKRLKENNISVEFADFPRYGQRSAMMVEDYLNGRFGSASEVGPYRASILYAVDRYAASFDIKKWLSEGKIVVCNRYVSANMGHQAGKIKDRTEREKFLAWLFDLEYNIFAIPKPDLTILLYVPYEIAHALIDKKEKRGYIGGKKRDIHEDDIAHLKDAEGAYLEVAKKYCWTKIDCAKDNAMMQKEKIAEIVWQKIKQLL